MIGLSMTTMSTGSAASVIIKENPASKTRNERARVSRYATLDGGSVIDHQGFSDGDRTFDIRASMSADEAELLWSMFRSQTYLNISTRDGFFYGVIESMDDDSGKVSLSILVKE